MTDFGEMPDLASQGSLANRREQMFPALNAAQLARLHRYGQRRAIRAGEILAEPGDRGLPMWVVLSGSIEAVQVGMSGETTVVTHTAGGFSGEMSTLRGISTMVRVRAHQARFFDDRSRTQHGLAVRLHRPQRKILRPHRA
jgi:thioredoxin reductase (NADPH)